MASPTISGYRRLSEIGKGGFSRVYSGEQAKLKRSVAIKVLNSGLSDEADRRRFERECELMGRVSTHPNIVTVHDTAFTDSGQPCIVMELYPGGSLADLIGEVQRLSPQEVLEVGVSIAAALEASHQAGVLHCDLKPQNILISEFGQPALGDFGISTFSEERTRTGANTGAGFTLAYAAPEIVEGASPSVESDVYSLAATLYTSLAGRRPLSYAGANGQKPTAAEQARRILLEEPASLIDLGVPPELDHVVRVAMAKDPSTRPRSAAEFATSLYQVGQQLELGTSTPRIADQGALPVRDARTDAETSAPAATSRVGAAAATAEDPPSSDDTSALPLSRTSTWPLPTTVGRYRVEGHAGSGAFASVYRCVDERLDSVVAIKVLADNWLFEPEVLRRFRDEAVLLRRLTGDARTRSVVQVFDIDQQANGQPFFVMEWAEGGTLADRVGDGVWTVEQVRPIVEALAEGLGHLHENDVIHRDIKPSNILIFGTAPQPGATLLRRIGRLAPNERLSIADLGLAKDLNDDLSNLSLVRGTERFAAPEQVNQSATAGAAADIYSATAVVKTLIANNAEASQGLAEFCRRGMAEDPDKRPQSASEWAALFEEEQAPTCTSTTKAGVVSRKSRIQIALLLGLLIATVVAGVTFFMPGPAVSRIVGPSQIESGEQAQYVLADAQGVLPWVRPDGNVDLTQALLITGRLPGEISISVSNDGEIHRRTIEVLSSPLGPEIQGPDRIDRSMRTTWTVIAQPGDRIQWSTSTGEFGSGDAFDFAAEGDFLLQVVAIDDSGVVRGEQLSVSVG